MSTAAPFSTATDHAPAAASVAPAVRCGNCGAAVAWYMYRSMRVVYGQGRWLTCGKLLLLAFFYRVSGTLMLALTTAYSALTL